MMKKKMTSSLDVILSSRLFMTVILLTVCSPGESQSFFFLYLNSSSPLRPFLLRIPPKTFSFSPFIFLVLYLNCVCVCVCVRGSIDATLNEIYSPKLSFLRSTPLPSSQTSFSTLAYITRVRTLTVVDRSGALYSHIRWRYIGLDAKFDEP